MPSLTFVFVTGKVVCPPTIRLMFCAWAEAKTAEERDAKAARNLQSALDNTVGADAEIHGVLVLVCTAERAQLDCGVYVKDVQRLASAD